ncbi:MAG: hypothetical protein U0263_11120 [Polyangiaceae bacterium]
MNRFLFALGAGLTACAVAGEAPPERPVPGAGPRVSVRPSASPARIEPPAPLAPPAAPSRETYDLGADLRERAVLAREELGPKTESEIVEGVFLLSSPGGKAALRSPLDVTERALSALFNRRFDKRPERAISVHLFPDASRYDAYCRRRWKTKCDSPYGFYLGQERKIVMNLGPGIGTLTHELVHPLVEADFPNAPEWLNEGIASLFEQFQLPRSGEIHGGKNWRHPRLIVALARPSEQANASLPALFALSDEDFRGTKEDLNYAIARYFCQWLDQRGLLWSFYRRYRDTQATDRTGEVAFREVTGETLEVASPTWRRWVRNL